MFRFPYHSRPGKVSKMTPKGKTIVFKTNRDMPYEGNCPMWAILRQSDRIKLLSVKP